MSTIILKKLSLDRIFYTILLTLLHIGFSNCNISKSRMDQDKGSSNNSPSTISNDQPSTTNKKNSLICINIDSFLIDFFSLGPNGKR
ncbi:MAG: hypothetical protein NMK33_03640 [Candidatus Cardinium sp.]|nr:MAG: hypothetical protein NMK33_03640 [Candidatus Cardinium sp.]